MRQGFRRVEILAPGVPQIHDSRTSKPKRTVARQVSFTFIVPSVPAIANS
jgi:hypothetical protein